MNIQSTGLSDDEPLVVSPRTACRMLSCGLTRLYELLGTGELESYRDGSSRRITTRSVRAYVERQLQRSQAA
jgi:excisionase family DNA binding protein